MIKFGTSGFRAIIGDGFTKENIQKVAQSLAKKIKQDKSTHPVIIGYDRRFMSKNYSEWFAEVLAGNNIVTKIYNRPVPTPLVMYGVKNEGYDYGIMMTASHNPYVYNGVKISIKGGKDAQVELTSQLEKIANSKIKVKTMKYAEAVEKKLIVDYDNMAQYIKSIEKSVSPALKGSKMKIIFNAMHGVTVESAQLFAKKFKLQNFTIVNETEDPYFNHDLPCPTEEHLEEFKKQVTKGRYHVGLACDADGDRIGIIDEKGTFHDCNTIMAVVYYYLVKCRNMSGDFVKTYATSTILDKLAESFGFKCHETPIGFKWVSSKMEETNALAGGESSGGFTIRNWTPTKDSMMAVALILDAIANLKKPLSKIVEEVKEFCGYISTFYESTLPLKDRKKVIKLLNKQTPNFSYKPVKIISEDGKKYVFEDGSWVLIRFSGTENLMRYYLEFPTEIECERNIKAIKNFIDKIK